MLNKYLVFSPEQHFIGTPIDAGLEFDHA